MSSYDDRKRQEEADAAYARRLQAEEHDQTRDQTTASARTISQMNSDFYVYLRVSSKKEICPFLNLMWQEQEKLLMLASWCISTPKIHLLLYIIIC